MRHLLGSALMFSALSTLSFNASAASYSGVGYTISWDDSYGLYLDGSSLVKDTSISHTVSPGTSVYRQFFDVEIFLDIDDGYYIETWGSEFYGSVSTQITSLPAASGTYFGMSDIKVRGSGGSEGYGHSVSASFDTTGFMSSNREPRNGEFQSISTRNLEYPSFDIPASLRFSLRADESVRNATLNYQINKIVLNIQVAAIPEPSTYSMLGLGLALLGFAARRRKAS